MILSLSLRKKLMLMLLLTSLGALFVSAAGFVISDWYTSKISTIERLKVMAGILGNNTVAALTFEDNVSAARTLDSLKSETDIVSAILYNQRGEVFASYRRDESFTIQDMPDRESGVIGDDFYVFIPINFDQAGIGHIMLVSDQSKWRQRQMLHIATVSSVFLLSFVFAFLISSRLQRVIADPVLSLARTARHISRDNDYAKRAVKASGDEIGQLVDDFNDMLDQIQHKDDELKRFTEKLEEKVEARTQALTDLTRQLEHQAYHDMLTGLANRTTFDNHLHLAIEQSHRYGGKLAVLFLDLDRFKVVNDTLGHAVGDKLLVKVADRFSSCMRASDTLARLGGDEFAVLLVNITSSGEVMEVAHKLRKVMTEPVEVDGYNLHPSVSIGISLYPGDGDTAESILKNADAAMYRSKDNGRNQITFFSPEMNTQAGRRLELENKLRQALRDGALEVHYQPRCDARTQKIIGVEALARWRDRDEGYISPSEFIPMAEECGLISAIDEWVLSTACRDVLHWYQGERPDISLAVNFSPVQFSRKDPHELVKRILGETGFPGNRLELEITESLFGPDSVGVTGSFQRICELGVEISVDDFGTAYSSLSRLKNLPLHTLKIDQSFVRDLGQDPNDETIVLTIITMAHNLNLSVVAEGVETRLQYEFVRQHGCDVVQGYLFGKPMPADEFEALLSNSVAAGQGSKMHTSDQRNRQA
jgi:diguanylate cyclase (GGDEF)-like protein